MALRTFLNRTDTTHISQIKQDTVKEYFYNQVKERDWSVYCYRNNWSYLRCFFNWAICNKKVNLKGNPVEKLEKPKKPTTVPRRLSKEQVKILFAECCTYPWKYNVQRARNTAIFATFLYTGVRIDELLNIRVEDISLNDRSVLIRKGKGRKVRVVKVPFELKRFLQDYELHLKRLNVRREYYFVSIGKYKKMTGKYIYAMRDKLTAATGIFFKPHQLRHTFASLCLEQKIPIASISKIMGHESILYTENYLAPEQNIMLSHFDEFTLY